MTHFPTFSDNSKVWVYQSNREFTAAEQAQLKIKLDVFTIDWSAHKLQLKAAGDVLYNRFIVLIVDEEQHGASGCSIDKSVKFIQEIEQQYAVTLMDRMLVCYRNKEQQTAIAHLNDLPQLVEKGVINAQTIVFNNLVTTKKELNKDWEIKIAESWHKNFLGAEI